MTSPSQIQILTATASGNASSLQMPATKRIAWLDKHLPDPEAQREYARDRCVTAFTEALGEIMQEANLSRTALAERLGKSPSQVSRFLNGAHNMTLHTLADVLWACGMEVVDPSLGFGPLGVVEVSTEDAASWGGLSASVGETWLQMEPQRLDQNVALRA